VTAIAALLGMAAHAPAGLRPSLDGVSTDVVGSVDELAVDGVGMSYRHRQALARVVAVYAFGLRVTSPAELGLGRGRCAMVAQEPKVVSYERLRSRSLPRSAAMTVGALSRLEQVVVAGQAGRHVGIQLSLSTVVRDASMARHTLAA
jgi:hypothetical protein